MDSNKGSKPPLKMEKPFQYKDGKFLIRVEEVPFTNTTKPKKYKCTISYLGSCNYRIEQKAAEADFKDTIQKLEEQAAHWYDTMRDATSAQLTLEYFGFKLS